MNGCIYCDEPLDSSLQQELGIFTQQLLIMPVNRRNEGIIHCPQMFFNALDDEGTVGITDLLRNHSDHIGPLAAQIPGEKVWTVIQLFRGSADAVFSFLRNSAGGGRIVEDDGNRARSQPHMLSHGLDRNDRRLGAGSLGSGHEFVSDRSLGTTKP